MSRRQPKPFKGFTYSEILIALLILVVAFGVTIAKIGLNRTQSVKFTVFKEIISSLTHVAQAGMDDDELIPPNSAVYFASHMNAIRICDTDATIQQCWTSVTCGAECNDPGFILSNGVTIAGLDGKAENDLGNGAWGDKCIIDWNGPKEPNVVGEDRIYVTVSFGSAPYNGVNPGAIRADSTSAPSVTLFNKIYGN